MEVLVMDNGDIDAALKTLLLKSAEGDTAQREGLAQCGALGENASQGFISYQGVEPFESD